jgi:DNA-binding SARP family transcriptional activator
VELRVLGPLEVRHDGSPVALRGAKPRQLLVLLAMRANRPVSSEQLIEQLWEGDPPPSAATALRVHVGKLRRALEPERGANVPSGRLPAGPHGYLLRIEPDELDAQRFERLVVLGRDANAAGDLRAAVPLLTQALDLWHGPAMVDVRDLSAARAEVSRLDELHVDATEELAEARLGCGEHAIVVDVLGAAVEEYPLRERLTAQLMLALYRCGRPTEALRAYAHLAGELDEQLGVQPSAEVRRLEEQVLLQDPALEFVPPRAATFTTRAAAVRFIGRRAELGRLLEIHADRAGECRLVLVSGAAGAGKSTLIEEFCHRAGNDGAIVLTGRCAPEPVGDYQPVSEILDAVVARGDEQTLAGVSPELAALVPGLDLTEPPRADDDPELDRFRLFEAVASTIATVASDAIVLVIEDVHWADRPTLALLRHLLRHPKLAQVRAIVSYREDEITGERAELLESLVSRGQLERVALEGFDDNEIRALVRAVAAPEAVPVLLSLTATLHEVTAGSPLFVRELLREIEEDPGKLQDSSELERALLGMAPVGVRALVERRLARLSSRARGVLRLAATLGRGISPELVCQACGLSPEATLDALEESLAVRLLIEDPAQLDRFAFPHALMRNVVYGSIPDERRMRLHRQIGEALERQRSESGQGHSAELAHHFGEAAPLGLAGKAAFYAREAGDEAASHCAFSEAARWYERSIMLQDATSSDGSSGREWLLLGRAFESDGQFVRARDAYLVAAQCARETGQSVLLAEVAVAASGPWSSGFEFQAVALALLDEALTALGDRYPRERVEVLGNLAAALYYVDADREARVAAQAEDLARSLGDNAALAQACLAVHRSLTHRPEARRERLALCRSALELTDVDASPLLYLRVHRALLADQLENTELDGFARGLDRYERESSELNSPRDLYWAMVLRATQAILRGDLALGEQLARGARLRGRELERAAAGAFLLQQFVIRYQQGRLAELVGGLRETEERNPAYRGGLALAALACVETGRLDEGLRLSRNALGADAQRLPRDIFWLAATCLFAGVAAATGDRELAAVLTEVLAPCADHIVVFGAGGAVLGTGHSWLGQLAVVQENPGRACEHFEEAARIADEIEAPYWSAQARIDLAITVARGGTSSAATHGRDLAREAVKIASERGYGRLVTRAANAGLTSP